MTRLLASLVLLVGVTAAGGARTLKPPACPEGRFDLVTEPLLVGGMRTAGDVVTLAAGRVLLDNGATFWPPFALAPRAWFDYECLHDNGVTRPVFHDDGSSPAALRFGISAENEMCILNGGYFDD